MFAKITAMSTLKEVKNALTGITIARAKALIALAKSNKEFPDTEDIRESTGFEATQLGGLGSALTKIKVSGKQLLEVRPIRPNRNTTQYIWNESVASKEQILKVLKDFGLSV